MRRVAKFAGVGNIGIEEVPVPEPGAGEVLIRVHRSLISRGSEIGRRYVAEEALDHGIMGYSAAGEVAASGAALDGFTPGQRVVAVSPHADFVLADPSLGDNSWVLPLPDNLSFERATFHPLLTSALMWAENSGVRPGDPVVILGQGLVGVLVMQALARYRPGKVITVDTLPRRCDLSRRLGATVVINAAAEDPIARVMEETDGDGAPVVIDCVGGAAGIRSFEQAQAMSADGGRIVLIALYQGAPLPLDASRLQRRTLVGGFWARQPRRPYALEALDLLASGEIEVDPLITHHFPGDDAKAAFDLLYERSGEAMGVLLDWV